MGVLQEKEEDESKECAELVFLIDSCFLSSWSMKY